jgi:hypothetical protein
VGTGGSVCIVNGCEVLAGRYRQITVWWRVCAFREYWRGDSGWGQMERRGLSRA